MRFPLGKPCATLLIAALLLLSLGATAPRPSQAQAGDPPPIFLPLVYQPNPIAALLAQMDFSRFTGFTTTLVNEFSPRHHDHHQGFINPGCLTGGTVFYNSNLVRSSKFVKDTFEQLGYLTTREFVEDGTDSYNVLAVKIGSLYPQVFIEVGAHIDTKEKTPGASDNAAAVAALLELATVLKDHPTHYSLRLISFVGEEYHVVDGKPYSLTGSRYHVEQILKNQEQLKASLILDGIGWSETAPALSNCIWDDGSTEGRRLANLFESVRADYQLDLNWRRCSPEPLEQVSDNVAYWELGLPAVLSIGGLPYQDPNYHTCTDNLETVNLANAFVTAQQNLAVLLELDEEPWEAPPPPTDALPARHRKTGSTH